MDHTAQALLLRHLASEWEKVANQVLPAGFTSCGIHLSKLRMPR